LIAPAESISVVGWNNIIDPNFGGTSSAAPHVTGAAALLHQYAKPRVDTGFPGWTTNAQRHEVIKAVLMTSADKLAGVNGSSRDVLNRNGATFGGELMENSLFYPLDRDIGAGHLNAKRALDLYKSGEQDPGIVPKLGWDYHTIGGVGSTVEYIFNSPGSGFVAATLTWDRRVELTDPDNTYSPGDDFFNRPWYQEVSQLDLYLIDKNETEITLANSEHASLCNSCNFEHIFFNVGAGEYKLVVKHGLGGSGASTDFGIAWWFGAGPPSQPPGDHNGDGSVDGADYVAWRKSPGDFGGDPAGYDTWRTNFGSTSGAGGVASVPEPGGFALAMMLIGGVLCGGRNARGVLDRTILH
jgi:hypothetical protein